VDNPAPRQDTRSQAAVGKQVWDPDGQAASERGVHTGASARAWLHVRAGCSSGSRGRWKGRAHMWSGRWKMPQSRASSTSAMCHLRCRMRFQHRARAPVRQRITPGLPLYL